MIKHFNTEAEYAAASLPTGESQVALIAAGNRVKFDGKNIVVGAKTAKTGSIAVLDSNNALHFISVDTWTTAVLASYTVVGVVAVGVDHKDYRGKIVIVNKANASKQWSAIYSFKLTGYTLDGTDRSGVLNVRDSSAWETDVNYTINYNCSNLADFLTTLNAYFQSTAPFTTQHWRADADEDGNVTLSFLFSDYRQASNTASAGFTLTANLLPDIPASSAMLRMNGQRSGEGTISNWDRAIAYFRQDNSSTNYNPNTNVTSPKRSYPICLPGYLGTSAYRMDGTTQLDYCAALRAIYGEGEAGWLKFMASFLPVRPTNYGPVGDKATYGDGKRNTYLMAGKTFTKQDGSVIVAHPAADYCANVAYNHELLGEGSWVLPDADTLLGILSTIKYGTNSNRNADPINRALNAINGSAISNGSYPWSSSRFSAYNAWYSNGSSGCMNVSYMFSTILALPVALLDVSGSEL